MTPWLAVWQVPCGQGGSGRPLQVLPGAIPCSLHGRVPGHAGIGPHRQDLLQTLLLVTTPATATSAQVSDHRHSSLCFLCVDWCPCSIGLHFVIAAISRFFINFFFLEWCFENSGSSNVQCLDHIFYSFSRSFYRLVVHVSLKKTFSTPPLQPLQPLHHPLTSQTTWRMSHRRLVTHPAPR